MTVLMFAEELRSLGGIEQSSLGVARLLTIEFGRNIDLIFGEDGDCSDDWAKLCRRRMKLGSLALRRRDPWKLISRLFRSVAFCLRDVPDVLYCQSILQLALGRALSVILRRRVVLHLRTAPPPLNGRNRRRIRSVDRAIAVSAFTADEWTAEFPYLKGRTAIVPNGIDLERFHPIPVAERDSRRDELGLPHDAYVVVFVGRFSPEKAPLDLIQAVLALNDVGINVQLALAGGVDRRSAAYGSQVMSMTAPNIQFIPACSRIERVIQAADLVVVPSHAETFGRVVVESLACGVPPLGARVGGIADILAEVPELLFTPGDISELRLKIAGEIGAYRNQVTQHSATKLRAIALRYGERETARRVDSILVEAATGAQQERGPQPTNE